MTAPRVVVAGLGDSGLLTAIHLVRAGVDVVGVSGRPGLVSGQELGLRLARPEEWARDYRIGFDRFRGLDRAEVVHAGLTGLDLDARTVLTTRRAIRYDVLVIATGVSNGFWRPPGLRTHDEITAGLESAHARLAAASDVLVVGGGAAAVGSALQLATRWPDKPVTLAFPGERPLPQHHPRVREAALRRLAARGVRLLAEHRAVVPEGFGCDEITTGPVAWSTGQPAADAAAVLWAIGRVRPNTDWLPPELLDEDGFVRVEPTLRVPAAPDVFAIGDVAATDPLRSSARNRADRMLARNVVAGIEGGVLAEFSPPRRRWGSVFGPEPDGLRVFAPSGHAFRFPAWSIDRVLQPWIVRRGIYRGVRSAGAGRPRRS